MFWCIPSQSKCEWENIKPFISFFNKEYNKLYIRKACLDIDPDLRNSKQPEVLLVDSSVKESEKGDSLVIERKSIVWPLDRVKQHSNAHLFADLFFENLKGFFTEGCFVLRVQAPFEKTKSKIKKQAQIISAKVIENRVSVESGNPIGGQEPLPWYFEKLTLEEQQIEEYPEGVTVNIIGRPEDSLFDPINFKLALGEVESIVIGALNNTIEKFRDYEESLKIVILSPYTEFPIREEDIKVWLPKTNSPTTIDQIWLENPGWVSNEEYELEYELLYNRLDNSF